MGFANRANAKVAHAKHAKVAKTQPAARAAANTAQSAAQPAAKTAQPAANVKTTQPAAQVAFARIGYKKALSVLLAGTLVVGTSLPVKNMAPKALAENSNNTLNGMLAANESLTTTTAQTQDSETGNANAGDSDNTGGNTNSGDADNTNTNTNSGDATNTSTNSGDADNTGGNTNSDTDSNSSASDASNTESATEDKKDETDYSDPDAAKPNGNFGAPTTDVVIEGSVNGEIMAKIALAEPDGKPEGGDYNKYNYGSGEPWCAYFVMYCARAAGLSTACIPNYPSCPMMVEYYKKLNRYQSFTTKYQPHVGDLIFYSSTQGGIAEHIGIVTASTATTVTTREGNTNDAEVATHVFSTTAESGSVGNSWYILGYASPDYPAQNDHEHTNNVKSITKVSETSHKVEYDNCTVCGEGQDAQVVSHNFHSTQAGVDLEDASEWVCEDCGFVQPHYTTGVMASHTGIKLYDPKTGALVREVQDASIVITKIEVGADGDYWGLTADGYKVKMSQAGIKQSDKFSEVEDADAARERVLQTAASGAASGEGAAASAGSTSGATASGASGAASASSAAANSAQATQTTQTTQASASASTSANSELVSGDTYELGGEDTHVKDSEYQQYKQAEAVEVADVKKGKMYLLEIKSATNTSGLAYDSGVLGTALCKLVYKDAEGNIDTSSFKYFGENSNKIRLTEDTQCIVVAPDFDATLVLACQYATHANGNNMRFEGVTLTELN